MPPLRTGAGSCCLKRVDGMKADYKTNVMRILDKAGVEYLPHSFAVKNAVSGTEAARLLGVDEKKVFKTLVTVE